MDLGERLALFSGFDLVAVLVLLGLWMGSTWLIEHPPAARLSTSMLMARYRRKWMMEFVTRQPRIFDSQLIGQLRQGTAFFASGAMLAIGGALALLGNTERLRGVAQDLTQEADPLFVWEIKLFLMLLFAFNAFLKFVWSHRLFGYCAVLMGAVPEDPDNPQARPSAARAGEINIIAAKAYNRGLRSVYFGIASVAWLAGSVPLLAAALVTAGVVLRREFASQSRAVLLTGEQDTAT